MSCFFLCYSRHQNKYVLNSVLCNDFFFAQKGTIVEKTKTKQNDMVVDKI